jgi:hypothetical protein
VLAVFGLVYRIHVRSLPAEDRVPAIYFLAMAVIMPVTYMILTPLALFTLDSGSWETRGHTAEPVEAAPAEAVRAEIGRAEPVRLESQSA